MHDVRAHVSYSAVQMRRERLTLHRRARAVEGTCANQRAESAIRPLCTAGGPTMSGSCTFAVPQGARPARTMNGSSSTAPHRRLLIDGCSLTAAQAVARLLIGCAHCDRCSLQRLLIAVACRLALDGGCSGRLCRVRGAGTASLPRKPSSNASQNKGWREEAILGKVPTKPDAFRQGRPSKHRRHIELRFRHIELRFRLLIR